MARVGLAAVAIVLLAPSAAAADVDGALLWSEPAASTGVVAPVPLGGFADALVYPATAAAKDRPRVVESGHLRATLYHWTDPGPLSDARLAAESWELHDASIYIEKLYRQANIEYRQEAGSQATGAETLVAARTCEIHRAVGNPQGPLPVKVPNPRGEAVIRSVCAFTGMTSTGPDRITFYGMRLTIEAREGTYTVETGDAGAPGLEQERGDGTTLAFQATSLEIEPLGAPLVSRFSFDGEATVMAPALLVVGGLTVPTSHGELRWGDQQQQGDVQPFSAKGEFLLTGRPDGHVEVTGQSLDEPQPVLASTTSGPTGGTTAAVAVVLAPLAALPFVLRFLVALWARHNGDRVLEHPRRASIYQIIERSPGIEVATVGRQLGIRPAKMHYHVRVLQDAGRVSLHRVAGRTSLFPTGMGFRGRELPIALSQRQPMARILDVLRSEPGLDQESLARRVELGQPQVSRHLSRLEEAQIVESRVASRRRRYFLAQAAAAPYAMAPAQVATP